MKNHLISLTQHAHDLKLGFRIFQAIVLGLGVLLVLQVHADLMQLLGVLGVLVLLLSLCEIGRRWVAASEMFSLKVTSEDTLHKTTQALRIGLLGLITLQLAWWLLFTNLLHVKSAWGAYFDFPYANSAPVQAVAGLIPILMWISIERWIGALQNPPAPHLPQLARIAMGLILLMQVKCLGYMVLLPLQEMPSSWLEGLAFGLRLLHALFLMVFLGWIRKYMGQLTLLHAWRRDRVQQTA